MNIGIIISILILIAGALIIFKITKTIAKTIFLTIALFLVIILIFGFILFMDIKDFQKNYPTQDSLYLLQYPDQDISAGVYGTFTNNLEEDIHFVQKNTLINYKASFDDNNLKSVLGNHYKLFLVKESAFSSIDNINIADTTITRDQFFGLISSKTPIEDFIDISLGDSVQENIKNSYKENLLSTAQIDSPTEFKDLLFIIALGTVSDQEKGFFLFSKITNDDIEVYPQTLMFQSLNIIPKSISEKLSRGESS